MTTMPLQYPIRLWPALFLVSGFVIPVWHAWLADFRPGTSHWDQLWENLPLFCGLLVFVLPAEIPDHLDGTRVA
jgi:hypothetical protein